MPLARKKSTTVTDVLDIRYQKGSYCYRLYSLTGKEPDFFSSDSSASTGNRVENQTIYLYEKDGRYISVSLSFGVLADHFGLATSLALLSFALALLCLLALILYFKKDPPGEEFQRKG